MIWRWLLVAVMLVLTAWAATQTLANWWAGGGPPTPHPEYYRHWGNVFFFVTCGLLVVTIALMVLNVKEMRKRRPSARQNPPTHPRP